MTFKKGFRYALYCFAGAMAMGALYGLVSGLVIAPAVFAVSFMALLVVMNFLVALPVWGVHFFILTPFRKGSRKVGRYFALSLSFFIVFVAGYLLLMNTGMGVF